MLASAFHPADSSARNAASTPGAADRFAREGYLVLAALFAFEEIAWLRHEASVAARRGGTDGAPRPPAAPVPAISGLHLRSDPFRRLAAHPRLMRIARDLLGADVEVAGSRLLPVGVASVPCGALAGATTPPASVIAAVFLGDASPRRPAAQVAPGAHANASGTNSRAIGIVAGCGTVLFARDPVLRAIDGGPDAASLPAFLIVYRAREAEESGAAVGALSPHADDCLWPTAWCVAG